MLSSQVAIPQSLGILRWLIRLSLRRGQREAVRSLFLITEGHCWSGFRECLPFVPPRRPVLYSHLNSLYLLICSCGAQEIEPTTPAHNQPVL